MNNCDNCRYETITSDTDPCFTCASLSITPYSRWEPKTEQRPPDLVVEIDDIVYRLQLLREKLVKGCPANCLGTNFPPEPGGEQPEFKGEDIPK
jgi:hypothetical protein